jgi:hypothetical protein
MTTNTENIPAPVPAPVPAVSKIIPREKWDSLTKVNQEFLTTLGFKRDNKNKIVVKVIPENPKYKNDRRSTASKPYYITQRVQCYCCHTTQTIHGIMELPYEKAPYLKFRHLDEIPTEFDLTIPYLHKNRSSCTCVSCHEVLSMLSKDELITKLLEKYNGNLCCLGGDKLFPKKKLHIKEDRTEDDVAEEVEVAKELEEAGGTLNTEEELKCETS